MTDIYITDKLKAKGNENSYTPGNGLELESDNVVVKDNKWYIEKLTTGEKIVFNYHYTVKKEDVGGEIKNTITELAGTPKLVIPRGETPPDLEEIVPVPVVGSVPVKKILHLTCRAIPSSGPSRYFVDDACLWANFVLFNDEGFSETLKINPSGNKLPIHFEYTKEGNVYELEGESEFKDIPIGEYKLREVSSEVMGDAPHFHDGSEYDVKVLSDHETEISINGERLNIAEFENTCTIWEGLKRFEFSCLLD